MNVTMTEEQFERILQMAVLGEYVVNAPAGAHQAREMRRVRMKSGLMRSLPVHRDNARRGG